MNKTNVRGVVTALSLTLSLIVLACGGDDPEPAAACSVETQTGCAEGLACESVEDGSTGCFTPTTVKGRVFDTATGEAIEGALVVARDANDVAASSVVVTDERGDYSLVVPVTRSVDGALTNLSVTLRADAMGYLSFPLPPRQALPVELEQAEGDPPILENSATDIGLIALPDATGLGAVSGTVLSDRPGGTLVVAGGSTGIADADGNYTVFNVPAGDVAVAGYTTGINLSREEAEVSDGETTTGVDLAPISDATATVSGSVQIVNAPGGSTTSVILVLEETFIEQTARGEAPPGLRAAEVSGAWSIEGVPDGDYVVLAAFENDDLVRDPDTSIGGTAIVHLTVDGSDETVEGFKATEALAVMGPDDGETVSSAPTFEWADDSSEGSYHLELFDAFGELVWEDPAVPEVSGAQTVSIEYSGPELEPGMIYQFRATSLSKRDGIPISRTEDLHGVFLFSP